MTRAAANSNDTTRLARNRRTTSLVAAVAIAAGCVSYSATAHVAAAGAPSPTLAWVVPITIEGAMAAALAVFYHARTLGRPRPELAATVAAGFGSLAVTINWSHASGGAIQHVLAASVPVGLAASVELIAALHHDR